MTLPFIKGFLSGFLLAFVFWLAMGAWAEPFLDLGLGATVFSVTTPDGAWVQEAFPHHFNHVGLAARAGLGYSITDAWSLTASAVRFGSVTSIAQAVPDASYDPILHRCLAPCPPRNRMVASDSYYGGEASLRYAFRISSILDSVRPFLRAGGAYVWHTNHVIADEPTGQHTDTRYWGHFPMALIGGGVCYRWVCAEATYYQSLRTSLYDQVRQDYPISTRWLTSMVSVQMALW